jgi:SHS family lactate transporter-like MFS transporter
MFWIGGLPALLALFIRFGVKESAVWEKKKHTNWGDLGRGILAQWRIFAYMTALMTMMIFLSHGTQDMYPTFLKVQRGFEPKEVAKIAIIYNIGALLGGISFGHLSDRFGRKRSMVGGILLAILVIPLWAYAHTTPLLVLGAFLMQFTIQGAWGVIPAHLSELSPDSVRGFLPGFAYQCGVLLGGSVAYIEAVFAEHTSYSNAMAGTAVTTFVIAALVVAFGPERHSARFGE